jgi:hypothetical protein
MKILMCRKYLWFGVICFIVLSVLLGFGIYHITYKALRARALKEFSDATLVHCPDGVLQWYKVNGYEPPGEIRNRLWVNNGVKINGLSVDLSDSGKDFTAYSKIKDLTVVHNFNLKQSNECYMFISLVDREKFKGMAVIYQYSDCQYRMNGNSEGFKKMLLNNKWLGVKEEDFERLSGPGSEVVLIEGLVFDEPVLKQREKYDIERSEYQIEGQTEEKK